MSIIHPFDYFQMIVKFKIFLKYYFKKFKKIKKYVYHLKNWSLYDFFSKICHLKKNSNHFTSLLTIVFKMILDILKVYSTNFKFIHMFPWYIMSFFILKKFLPQFKFLLQGMKY
jgi:hypothetical protein